MLCIPNVPPIDSEVYKRFAQTAAILGSHLEMIAGTMKRAQEVFDRSFIVFDEYSDLMVERRHVVKRRGKVMIWKEDQWDSIAQDLKTAKLDPTISRSVTSLKHRATTSEHWDSK